MLPLFPSPVSLRPQLVDLRLPLPETPLVDVRELLEARAVEAEGIFRRRELRGGGGIEAESQITAPRRSKLTLTQAYLCSSILIRHVHRSNTAVGDAHLGLQVLNLDPRIGLDKSDPAIESSSAGVGLVESFLSRCQPCPHTLELGKGILQKTKMTLERALPISKVTNMHDKGGGYMALFAHCTSHTWRSISTCLALS